jgi:dCTP deaminase
MYLVHDEILKLYDEGSLVIRPLLTREQFGEISIDLRLGTDFLVSVQSREPYIDATGKNQSRSIGSYFQETKRLVGESFFFHPYQTVLCSTLEYIKLPDDIFLILTTRSSYSRLGLSISSIVQPGYCGCVSLELTNVNNNPIKILVGAAIVQARLCSISNPTDYFSRTRKYHCQVRPIPSRANLDTDLDSLKNLFSST